MQQRKIFVFSAMIYMSVSFSAFAQLSANPWAVANEKEDIAEVYEKRQRRGRGGNIQHYTKEDTVTIDRTHAYIQDEAAEDKDASFLDKLKNKMSSSDEDNAPLIPNTQDNRRILEERKQQEQARETTSKKDDDSLLSTFGFNKQISSLKKSMKLPNVNATGMIRKFEKASGINLKSIGRQMKGK